MHSNKETYIFGQIKGWFVDVDSMFKRDIKRDPQKGCMYIKRDLQKKSTRETCIHEKRPAKETYMPENGHTKETYIKRDLQDRPINWADLMAGSSIFCVDAYTSKETCKRDVCTSIKTYERDVYIKETYKRDDYASN